MTIPRTSLPTATRTSIAVVAPSCTVVHHVALRSADLARSREFYVDALGLPLLMEGTALFIVLAGQTSIGVHGPASTTPPDDTFDPARVGLEHVTLGCESDDELARVAGELAARGVETSGVCTDELFGRRYVAFRDPDGIRWELSRM